MSLDQSLEMRELLSWIGDPPRSPDQTHGLNESDSEIVSLGNGTYLAATIDTVSEEIEAGLYKDAYRIGWVAAMASLSDLAAVGAKPLGMLLSAEWGKAQTQQDKVEIARGFSDALKRCGTYWLGGDTGRTRATVLGGVGLGICDSKPMSRKGMRPGDVLCYTGELGLGPALAIRYLRGEDPEAFAESHYLPVARVDAGQPLRGLASACMDTSDGLLQTLRTLCALNGAGLELDWNEDMLAPAARAYCQERGIPLWMLWEVEHGDYQLALSIPDQNLEKAKLLVPDLHVIGRVSEVTGMRLHLPAGRILRLEPELAHSLLSKHANDVAKVLHELTAHAQTRGLP